MNTLVFEIEKNRERIVKVTLHINNHKGGMVAGMLESVRAKQEGLYDELNDHCTAWLKKLEENK